MRRLADATDPIASVSAPRSPPQRSWMRVGVTLYDQPAVEFLGRYIGDNVLGDFDNSTIGNGDVDKRLPGFGPPRLPQYEVDRHPGPGF